MERLISWLPEHLPQKEDTTVVHGDFRCEFLIVPCLVNAPTGKKTRGQF